MPTIKFTVRSLDALKPPNEGRAEYWDMDMPGLGLRISDRGKQTWQLMYRLKGRQRRMKLGVYPSLSLSDARRQARAHLRDVDLGNDPAAKNKAERQAETFSDLADLYLEKHAKAKKRSWETDRRILNHDLRPAFAHRKVREIKRRDVIALMDKIVDRGAPIMANRTLEVLRKMFNFAISREIVEMNPCVGVSKPGAETRRERVLTVEEIRTVWGAIDEEPDALAAMFKLRLLTAQRGGEILSMRWQDVDLDDGWWTIPGEFSKNGRAHRVPLTDLSVDVVSGLDQADPDNPWIFPGPKRDGPMTGIWHSGNRIRESSGVDFVPHDLRRSVASHMTSMGVNRLVVAKILNHSDSSVTATYDRHSYDKEKRAALEAWGRRLEKILSGETAQNVVPLRPA